MSEEQLNEAKFKVVQDYSDLKTRQALLEDQLKTAGQKYRKIGNQIASGLSGSPLSENETFPTAQELLALYREYRQVSKDFQEAKARLADIGLNLS